MLGASSFWVGRKDGTTSVYRTEAMDKVASHTAGPAPGRYVPPHTHGDEEATYFFCSPHQSCHCFRCHECRVRSISYDATHCAGGESSSVANGRWPCGPSSVSCYVRNDVSGLHVCRTRCEGLYGHGVWRWMASRVIEARCFSGTGPATAGAEAAR